MKITFEVSDRTAAILATELMLVNTEICIEDVNELCKIIIIAHAKKADQHWSKTMKASGEISL